MVRVIGINKVTRVGNSPLAMTLKDYGSLEDALEFNGLYIAVGQSGFNTIPFSK